MAPIFFDPHACSPPPTADLIGREMDFECPMREALAAGALLREGRVAPGAVVDLAVGQVLKVDYGPSYGDTPRWLVGTGDPGPPLALVLVDLAGAGI